MKKFGNHCLRVTKFHTHTKEQVELWFMLLFEIENEFRCNLVTRITVPFIREPKKTLSKFSEREVFPVQMTGFECRLAHTVCLRLQLHRK
jgi:hypothetical protein